MNGEFIRALLEVIPRRVSKGDAAGLLKKREKPYSASNWAELVDRRLLPALDEEAIDEKDLVALWRDAEDQAGYHDFLYVCPEERSRRLIAPAEVKRRAAQLEISELLERPLPVHRPRSPKIADLRWESEGEKLVIKVEETRRYKRVGKPEENGSIVREIQWESVPAMNFLEIHADGLVELRLQSHPSWAREKDYPDYQREIGKMRQVLEPFLSKKECAPLPLVKARNALWAKRSRLPDDPRFVYVRLRNEERVLAEFSATGRDGDLAASAGARKAIDAFLRDGGHCEEISLWWFGVPVTLRRLATNELVIGRGCSKESHAGILAGVLSLN